MRGELDDVQMEQIDSKLPDLTAIGDKVLALNPNTISMCFLGSSKIPVASPCLDDALGIAQDARYALTEAFAHLAWHRKRVPIPNEATAFTHGLFYTSAAASCLYAAAEDVAAAIVNMLEFDLAKINPALKDTVSLQSRVGAYLLKHMPDDPITKAVEALNDSSAWRDTRTFRDHWVHESVSVQAPGIRFDRTSRWQSVENGKVEVLRMGVGGDPGKYTVDQILEFVTQAFSDFASALAKVVDQYLKILSENGISFDGGKLTAHLDFGENRCPASERRS